MNRRALIKALGSAVLLSGGAVPSLVWSQGTPQLLVPPVVTSTLFHVFGVLPEPVEIKRVFVAGMPASLFVNSVAPKQLLGWPAELPQKALPWLSEFSRDLPLLAPLADVNPDIIIQIGDASEQELAKAQQLHEQTGIPYVVVAGGIKDSPEQLRTLGAILGHQRHGQQLAVAAQEVLDEVMAKRTAFKSKAPSIYLAHSDNGLQTVGANSTRSEVIDLVGAKNVVPSTADGQVAPVSIEQVMAWDPELILTQNIIFYNEVYNSPPWQELAAVRNKKVFFIPDVPFAWLDGQPSVNRLFGALWLCSLLHQEEQSVLIEKLRHLFILFFAYDPGQKSLQDLLNNPVAFAA